MFGGISSTTLVTTKTLWFVVSKCRLMLWVEVEGTTMRQQRGLPPETLFAILTIVRKYTRVRHLMLLQMTSLFEWLRTNITLKSTRFLLNFVNFMFYLQRGQSWFRPIVDFLFFWQTDAWALIAFHQRRHGIRLEPWISLIPTYVKSWLIWQFDNFNLLWNYNIGVRKPSSFMGQGGGANSDFMTFPKWLLNSRIPFFLVYHSDSGWSSTQYSTVFRVQKKKFWVPSLKPLEINFPKAQWLRKKKLKSEWWNPFDGPLKFWWFYYGNQCKWFLTPLKLF